VNIQESKAIITISNTASHSCPFLCDEHIGGPDYFNRGVNHLISAHSCTLLHVGGDTTVGLDDKPWQGTVAVLGSPIPLPDPPLSHFPVTPAPTKAAG